MNRTENIINQTSAVTPAREQNVNQQNRQRHNMLRARAHRTRARARAQRMAAWRKRTTKTTTTRGRRAWGKDSSALLPRRTHVTCAAFHAGCALPLAREQANKTGMARAQRKWRRHAWRVYLLRVARMLMWRAYRAARLTAWRRQQNDKKRRRESWRRARMARALPRGGAGGMKRRASCSRSALPRVSARAAAPQL